MREIELFRLLPNLGRRIAACCTGSMRGRLLLLCMSCCGMAWGFSPALPPLRSCNVGVQRRQRPTARHAEAGGEFDFSAFAAEVERRSVRGGDAAAHAAGSGPVMDGDELRRLVVAKWGKPFDTRIHRRRDARQELKFYLQVMWKHVEQQSFHMSEGEYSDQLQAVAELITEWGMADYVREQIRQTDQRPGIGVGRGPISGAVCVSIPLVKEDADGVLHPMTEAFDWERYLEEEQTPEGYDRAGGYHYLLEDGGGE